MLLGIEGEAAKALLQALRVSLIGWTFGARRRRPAPDAVNALLNWLAHLLTRDIEIAIRRRGLHPGFGYLHATEDGRAALAFDLIEELRAPVVEATALTMFNSGSLQAHHFFTPDGEDGRCWITPDGIATVIRIYEAQMVRERLHHPDIEHATSWRGVIDAQLARLVAHVEDQSGYQAYRIRS